MIPVRPSRTVRRRSAVNLTQFAVKGERMTVRTRHERTAGLQYDGMGRSLGIIAVGILFGLAIIWLVMSQMPTPRQQPVMDGIRRPGVATQPPSR
jgi:hypothetical protein